MGIVGGAVLTPAMGLISEWSHSIALAYIIPLLAYAGVALYSFFGTELSRGTIEIPEPLILPSSHIYFNAVLSQQFCSQDEGEDR